MRFYKIFLTIILLMLTVICNAAEPNLIAFVGEKISIEPFKPKVRTMDSAFYAKYRVLQVIFGTLPAKEITFAVYDHYGEPRFSNYKHVLLFISKSDDGSFYHQKYQYFPVYKTKDGRWFGCGSPYQNEGNSHCHMTAYTEDVEYEKPVYFSLKGLKRHEIKERYPAEFFSYIKGRAYCKKGAPVDELFRVKREGVLRARGIFNE